MLEGMNGAMGGTPDQGHPAPVIVGNSNDARQIDLSTALLLSCEELLSALDSMEVGPREAVQRALSSYMPSSSGASEVRRKRMGAPTQKERAPRSAEARRRCQPNQEYQPEVHGQP